MIDQEHYDHQRFSGARTLLEHADLRPGVVPTDLAGRKALLEPMVRAAWDCEQRGGRSLEEVAAELYAAADLMESGDDAPLRGITGTPEVLRAIAEHVAEGDRRAAEHGEIERRREQPAAAHACTVATTSRAARRP